MFRAMKIAGPCLDILREGWLPRLLALPLLCLLLALSAHVSQAVTIDVDSDCELPAAIIAANTDSNTHDTDCTAGSGADTLNMSAVASPYVLSAAMANITSDITIEGHGKTIHGNDTYQIFNVTSGGRLTLNRVTLERGEVANTSVGGAIINFGAVKITNSAIQNGDAGYGGAITSSGSLTIINSTLSSNSANAPDGIGGALYLTGGATTISSSALMQNTATLGGAIHLSSGNLTISNSTIANGSVSGSAGGGGIYVGSGAGTVTLTHVTMFENTLSDTSAIGSELYVTGSGPRVYLRNSIVADSNNTQNRINCALVSGASLRQNVGNLIQLGSGNCTSTYTFADMATQQPGPPPYYLPSSISDSNDIGDMGICRQYPIDQRGARRNGSCDAGAIERGGENWINVDSDCTLVDAVKAANTNRPVSNSGCEAGKHMDIVDVIWLRRNVTTGEDLQDIQGLTRIEGMGRTIDANSNALFDIQTSVSLSINNVTITGGGRSNGGAIYKNNGTVTVTGVTFESNSTSGDGGAINQASGTTTISRSAFINNTAGGGGGAIYQSDGTLTISSSTFIDNDSTQDGGGIHISSGTATLAHLTLWNNHNTASGGDSVAGLQAGGITNLYNSIIGREEVSTQKLCGGSFNNNTQQRGVIIHNRAITNEGCPASTSANPQLGGKSGRPAYLPLGESSPARGKGIAAQCALYPRDQRGAARPATNCDIGALQYIESLGETGDIIYPPTPRVPDPCTGRDLNNISDLRITTSYDLCSGTQFQRLDPSGVGIQWIIDGGLLDAVDVWGWVRPTVEVCFPQAGKTLFLDAAYSPRSVQPLSSFRDGDYTCARTGRAGTIVLMSPDSPHGTAPGATSPGPLVSPAPAQAAPAQPPPEPTAIPSTALSGCMVRTKAILNLRSSPGGAIVGLVPWEAWLTALEHAPGWFKVDNHGAQGWISADYVEPRGDCA